MKAAAVIVSAMLMATNFAVAQDKKPDAKKPITAWTDPATAPIDFKIQGEYANDKDKVAFQVVARGNGKFDVYLLEGGLPGAGWNSKAKKAKTEANLYVDDGLVPFELGGYQGKIHAKKPEMEVKFLGKEFTLPRVERKSSTLGARPPEGAIILFDGKNADEWKPGKMAGDFLAVPNTSKRSFENFKLHIEFRTPFEPTKGGQGRGNSGVYVCGREVQVLDSFGLQGNNNECGGLYGQRAPDVNMCFPPLSWQTFDIEHRAGAVNPNTKKTGSPRITVRHNGILIHDSVELKGGASKGNINLQNHGNAVVYRNVWVVEMK